MLHEPPFIRDRLTNHLQEEKIEGHTFMKWIWRPQIFRFGGWILTYTWPAKLYGWWNSQRWSRSKIPSFIEKHQIPTHEFTKTIDEYQSFNDFFCRQLKPVSRPISDPPSRLISPSDGKLLVWPQLTDNQILILKDNPIQLKQLLNDTTLETQFKNGQALLLRLAPPDYHRFHLPNSGILDTTYSKPGRLYSVHPYALKAKHPVYHLNAHHKTLFKSEHYGPILIIEVGATFVGQIQQTAPSQVFLSKGTEKGLFQIGGSAILMLFENDRVDFDPDLIEWTQKGIETQVKMGEGIGNPSHHQSRKI